ncbi:MAG: VCBS repeat-containing protein [Lysobacteraceae bacterium]
MSGLPDAEAIVDIHGGDLDGDGLGDLYVTASVITVGPEGAQAAVRDWILWGGPQGPVLGTVALDAATPHAGVSAAFADFDRDGDVDIVVAGGAVYLGGGIMQDAPSVVYANLGNRQFSAAIPFGNANRSAGLAVFDWDNDGAADVLLSHTDGSVSVYRNLAGVQGSLGFTLTQTIIIGGLDGLHAPLAAANLDGDNRLDLVVLRRDDWPPSPAAGVAYLRNVGGSNPFQPLFDYALPLGTPMDLAVADLDGNGLDDVAVAAAMPVSFVNPPTAEFRQSASRLLLSQPGPGFSIMESPMRFPPLQDLRIEAADLNGDLLDDLVLTHDPCPPYQWLRPYCPEPDHAALTVWLRAGNTFRNNRQFLAERHGGIGLVELTDMSGDELGDIITMGPLRAGMSSRVPEPKVPNGIPTAFTVLWNDGLLGYWAMCVAQWLYGLESDVGNAPGQINGNSGSPVIDLGAFSGTRDLLMPASDAGARLIARYNTFSPEVIDLAIAHPELAAAAASTLAQWSQPVRALLNGDGPAYTVSQEMIDVVDTTLALMSQHGSIALQDVIADERSRLPPLPSLVGLDMDGFLAATLPNSRLFRDGFED